MPDQTIRLNIEIPRELHADLKAACAQDHTSIKDKVLELIAAYTSSKK